MDERALIRLVIDSCLEAGKAHTDALQRLVLIAALAGYALGFVSGFVAR